MAYFRFSFWNYFGVNSLLGIGEGGKRMITADVGLIFRLAGLAIIISIFYTFLKQAGRDEYAYMTLLAGLAITLLWVIPLISDLIRAVQAVFQLY
ncbi:MAG: stage sporulation protein [Clostridia bacterium]|nr:stage sporulation protein [Clostridia bacterium]